MMTTPSRVVSFSEGAARQETSSIYSEGKSFSSKMSNESSSSTSSSTSGNHSSLLFDQSLTNASSISITSTFRQLQHKCRNIETSRSEALRERDELQRLLQEQQRRESMLRSRASVHSAEVLQGVQDQVSKVESTNSLLKVRMADLECGGNSTQDIINVRRQTIETLESELGIAQGEIHTLNTRIRDYKSEISAGNARADAMTSRQEQRRIAAAEGEARTKALLVGGELELARVKQECIHSRARAEAIGTYMQLLLRINKDLCDAVYAREIAEKQMKKFVLIPRYSWPKGVVEKAQAVLTDSAAEHALEIKRREEVKVANKSFKDAIRETKHYHNHGRGNTSNSNSNSNGNRRNTQKSSSLNNSVFSTRIKSTRPSSSPGAGYGSYGHGCVSMGPHPFTSPSSRSASSKKTKNKQQFASHQRDINMQALRSAKVGSSVRSIAGFLRPKSY